MVVEPPDIPPISLLRTLNAADAFSNTDSRLNIAAVLMHRLRNCIAYLLYPTVLRPQPQEHIAMLEKLLVSPSFSGLCHQCLYGMIDKDALKPGWQQQLGASEIATARTFTQALLRRLHSLVLRAFTRFIATVDLNCNIQLFVNLQKTITPDAQALVSTWQRILSSDSIVKFPTIDASTPGAVISVSNIKLDPFVARFPFSYCVAPLIQDLIDLNPTRSDYSDHESWIKTAAFVDERPVGQTLGETSPNQSRAYLHDLINLKLPQMPQISHAVPAFVATLECLSTMQAVDVTSLSADQCFKHVAYTHLALLSSQNIARLVLSIQSKLYQLSIDTSATVRVFEQAIEKQANEQGLDSLGGAAGEMAMSGITHLSNVIAEYFEQLEMTLLSLFSPHIIQRQQVVLYSRAVDMLTGAMSQLLSWVSTVDTPLHACLAKRWNKLR